MHLVQNHIIPAAMGYKNFKEHLEYMNSELIYYIFYLDIHINVIYKYNLFFIVTKIIIV